MVPHSLLSLQADMKFSGMTAHCVHTVHTVCEGKAAILPAACCAVAPCGSTMTADLCDECILQAHMHA